MPTPPPYRARTLTLAGLALSLLCGFAPAARAQDTVPTDKTATFGHSMLGDAFNDVPRQRAYLMKGMPNVHFAITTKNALAQRFFDQGIGQMHGYWYLEALRSFRKVVELDPASPMGYWGLALAAIEDAGKSKEFIAKAMERQSAGSERERLWIRSLSDYINANTKSDGWQKKRELALMAAWQNIVTTFPDDIEAKAFLAHEYLNNQYLDPKRSREQIDTLMKQVLAANPQHPIHHYRIHLWDQATTEKNALNSAAQCGVSGPGIAHLWHMQGHTYTGLHRYADAAYSQEASARVDHAYMMRDHVLPDEIHNYAHNNQWLIENLEYLGRVHEALDLAKNMIELPRHPRFNTLDGGGSSDQGRRRLIETLLCYDLWNDALELDRQGYIEPTDVPDKQASRLALLAEASFATGDRTNGRKYLDALLAMQAEHEPKEIGTDNGSDKSGKGKNTTSIKKQAAAENAGQYDAKMVASKIAEVRAHEALAADNAAEAARQLDLAVQLPPARAARLRLRCGQKAKAEQLAQQADTAKSRAGGPACHAGDGSGAKRQARGSPETICRPANSGRSCRPGRAPVCRHGKPGARIGLRHIGLADCIGLAYRHRPAPQPRHARPLPLESHIRARVYPAGRSWQQSFAVGFHPAGQARCRDFLSRNRLRKVPRTIKRLRAPAKRIRAGRYQPCRHQHGLARLFEAGQCHAGLENQISVPPAGRQGRQSVQSVPRVGRFRVHAPARRVFD